MSEGHAITLMQTYAYAASMEGRAVGWTCERTFFAQIGLTEL